MAVPTYSEDLTDINSGAENTTSWSALGGGGAGLSADPDFAIQGTNAVTKQVTGAGTQKGMMFDFGSGITMGANDHVFQWIYATCPGLIDTLASSGMTVSIGTTTGNFNDYSVNGSDTYRKGGHFCYPIRYTTGTPSPGTQTGTPGANPQWFGGQLKTTGTIKAVNLSIDMCRYGTGAYITAGDSGTPATFSGFATQNDNASNQWGILTAIPGGFALQGRFVIGQNNAGTPTLCYFSDSNANIVFSDTPHSLTDFTQVIADHASSTVIWDNVSFTALGTNNPGRIVFNNASTTGTITGGTWTSIGTTVLGAGVTVDGTTWRTTDSITLNQATLDNCVIDKCTASSAVFTDDLGDLTLNHFVGDSTGHAVELSSIGAGSMTWNNTFDTTTYATVDGSTGNEAIYVNVGSGSLTINVSAGATTPTIRTAGATVTVVAGAVTVQVTAALKAGTPVENARVFLKASDGTGPFPFQDAITSITRSTTTATVTTTSPHGMATNDKIFLEGITDKVEDNYTVKQITVLTTTTFTYTTTDSGSTAYTGTKTVTFVALNGLTNASGILSTSRVYSSNQPVTGWTRKSTSSPFLQEGVLVGEVDSSAGFSGTAVMLSDE